MTATVLPFCKWRQSAVRTSCKTSLRLHEQIPPYTCPVESERVSNLVFTQRRMIVHYDDGTTEER